MTKIKSIKAREVLDSRGQPTIEAEVCLKHVSGIASVPSGASTGKKEALELRDNDPRRYMGLGVLKAISNIENKIQPALIGKSVNEQQNIDNILVELDGTANKSNLGANATLAVSLAVARASSNYHKLELYKYLQNLFHYGNYNENPDPKLLAQEKPTIPTPLVNVVNGGAHADNNLSIQEFMIVPVGANKFSEALRYSVEVFYALKSVLKQNKLITAIGDEGGFAPNLTSNEQAMEYILSAVNQAGFMIDKDIALALDVAANEIFVDNYYVVDGKKLSTMQFIDKLNGWVNNYPIVYIEDGLAEDDLSGWQELTKRLGYKVQVIGDDLFATNPSIFEDLVVNKEQIADSILIKPNQVGTLSETFKTITLAKKYKYNYILSHRSGETEDSFIVDLAVATNAKRIKVGSVCRSERIAKYNRLSKIAGIITS